MSGEGITILGLRMVCLAKILYGLYHASGCGEVQVACPLHLHFACSGVAQHAQGDLDAALQLFGQASQFAEQAVAASSDTTASSGEAALPSKPDEAQEHDAVMAGHGSEERANRTLAKALMSTSQMRCRPAS